MACTQLAWGLHTACTALASVFCPEMWLHFHPTHAEKYPAERREGERERERERQETRDKRQRDKRQETRDKRQET